MTDARLPTYLDEHSLLIEAHPAEVWRAVADYAAGLTRTATPWGRAVEWLLGAESGRGFAVVEEQPGRLVALGGRHRFARYRLEFELADAGPSSTRLTARSFSDWRGPAGRCYGALVVRSGAHRWSVRHMLRAVRDRLR